MQKRLDELGERVVGLESEVNRLNKVRDLLMSQTEELKNRLAD
jgi:chaperonin cofactor prefoldin